MYISAVKFVSTSETIFFKQPYSEKLVWLSALGNKVIGCLLSLLFGICCGNLQYTKEFVINDENVCTHHFPWPAGYFTMQCTSWNCIHWYTKHMVYFLILFYVSIHIDPVHWFSCKELYVFNPSVVAVQIVQYLLWQCKRYNYLLAFHHHTINHYQTMSYWSIPA